MLSIVPVFGDPLERKIVDKPENRVEQAPFFFSGHLPLITVHRHMTFLCMCHSAPSSRCNLNRASLCAR